MANPAERFWFALCSSVASALLLAGCAGSIQAPTTLLREGVWGIYELDLETQSARLIYSTNEEMYASALRLNGSGDRLVFAQKVNGQADTDSEVFSIGVDGQGLRRLTNNNYWDLYPAWSPDGSQIGFLSKREANLDIYTMDADGSNARKLYDSGDHDADIDWAGGNIVFTSQFAIWRMEPDGTGATRVTSPPGRGEWGKANLPKGDYDPRLSYDGRRIAFERLEDVSNPNGGYNLFAVNIDGTQETRLTDSGWSQGLASWSHSAEEIVYVVAAVDGEGRYDLYVINSDGSDSHSVTPSYFPRDFLCHAPVFSLDDSRVFFIGQWWK